MRTIRSKKLRREVWYAAQGYCQHCGTYIAMDEPFEVDHIIPFCKGGPTTLGNSQLLCSPCNRLKGKSDDGFQMGTA